MRRPIATSLATVLMASLMGACDAPADGLPQQDDAVGGKADGQGQIAEGTAEARAILRLANALSAAELDDEVGLDRRAATGIVARRDASGAFTTLTALDAVPFVGTSAFAKLLTFATEQGLVGRSLRIATFNLRWYGLDGDLSGSIGTESRTASIRAFMDEHLPDPDVIVFQEVVDLDLFARELVPEFTCVSYDGFSGKHQHVVLCHRPELEFVREDDDTNFALEALNPGRLRPGVHGKLVDRDGEPLAHVIAVHLKAKEDSTEQRLAQARVLSDRLDTLADGDDLPAILIGDFNTHRADVTGRDADDELLLGEILDEGNRVHRVDQGVVHTHRERDGVGFRLDQAWVSPTIDVDQVAVPGPCNRDSVSEGAQIVAYYDAVSDHCPVSLALTLP